LRSRPRLRSEATSAALQLGEAIKSGNIVDVKLQVRVARYSKSETLYIYSDETGLKRNGPSLGTLETSKNGLLPSCTYRYPFIHRSQAALGQASTWIGDQMPSTTGSVRLVYMHLDN
jgi:hypothetical protein